VLFDDVVERVGAERFQAAREAAWSCAAGTGRCGAARSWPGDLALVPHEFSDAWYGEAPLTERLEMGLRLYREIPCYASTIELKGFYGAFGDEHKRALWAAVRSLLDGDDDRLADPLTYALWVDFFEDRDTVAEAWRETTRRDVEPWRRRIARVLDVAGPVSWPLKEELFAVLVGDERLHPAILRALAGSAFDVCGQLDQAAAAGWLRRLRLAPETPDLPALRVRLGVPV